MKRVLIISRREERDAFDNAERMAANLQPQRRGVVFEPWYFEDLVVVYDGDRLRVLHAQSDTDITAYDAVFLLGWFTSSLLEEMALICAQVARRHGIPVVNSEVLGMRSRSKVSQYVLSALHGLKATTAFCYSMRQECLLAGLGASGIGYPFILKAPAASRGNDNYLVRTPEALHKILHDNPGTSFLIQRYVPNDGGDLRLIVLGKEVRLAIGRTAPAGTHLSNTSKGGKAALVPLESLPAAILDEAVEIAGLLKREVTGVDVIRDKNTGDYHFLEANNMPQLSTGAFTEAKAAVLAEYLEHLA